MEKITEETLPTTEENLNHKLQIEYENAIETAVAFNMISNAEIQQDIESHPVGSRHWTVPPWETIIPSRAELLAREKLEKPIMVISIPGLSLAIKVRIAHALDDQWKWRSELIAISERWGPRPDESGNLISWNPKNPKRGRTKEERLADKTYTSGGIDVLFLDGGDQVPDSTLRLDAYDLREMCEEQGLIQPDVDAYIALQLEGVRRRRAFDTKVYSWLDGYVKSLHGTVTGKFHVDSVRIAMYECDPGNSQNFTGGRRAVRLKKKSQKSKTL